jgi:hypothetical protein
VGSEQWTVDGEQQKQTPAGIGGRFFFPADTSMAGWNN